MTAPAPKCRHCAQALALVDGRWLHTTTERVYCRSLTGAQRTARPTRTWEERQAAATGWLLLDARQEDTK